MLPYYPHSRFGDLVRKGEQGTFFVVNDLGHVGNRETRPIDTSHVEESACTRDDSEDLLVDTYTSTSYSNSLLMCLIYLNPPARGPVHMKQGEHIEI